MFTYLVTENRTAARRQELLASAEARRAVRRPRTAGAARQPATRRRSRLWLASAPACR